MERLTPPLLQNQNLCSWLAKYPVCLLSHASSEKAGGLCVCVCVWRARCWGAFGSGGGGRVGWFVAWCSRPRQEGNGRLTLRPPGE